MSGLHKLQYADWWSGAALWYPHHPPFDTTLETLSEETKDLRLKFTALSVVAYLALAWQIAFPAFAWRTRWRPLLLVGALAGWWGCFFIYRLPLFGPAYLLGCLSFLTVGEWQWVVDLLARLKPSGAAAQSTSERSPTTGQDRMAPKVPSGAFTQGKAGRLQKG
jgi:hypothetical protein